MAEETGGTPRAPGDQAAPDSAQTGMVPCPTCHGSGKQGQVACPTCNGSGQVVQIVGDA
jgi:DnaJ-class molecular chaperone